MNCFFFFLNRKHQGTWHIINGRFCFLSLPFLCGLNLLCVLSVPPACKVFEEKGFCFPLSPLPSSLLLYSAENTVWRIVGSRYLLMEGMKADRKSVV